ncbi:uncharacterized protein CTHT_0037300 [Thermochaetoides thermophila DSM 1495]|uniref:Chitin-binding type-1 domain-containing protein n=1 Tax=Chaetomium thermophilum (strain DSM 1495 / CBS 144.50 / IMI 039719) TaxID=759272 RepID=G0S7X2_CHATD|nr:hypothetical protein CTHT_0037300 [Thermochaetoides thermophila DSM 1495]EGS21859.1 hypothetical protein CTHT_0037300 [Thermochaetoides thermophila DSM 1495]
MVAPSFTKTLFLLAFGLTYTTAAVANPSVSSNAAVLDDEDPVPEDLIVSTDGSCGGGITCLGSRFGDCCSEYGYCGRTYAYCGPGCQSAFGFCDPDVEQPSSTIETVFTTVTATVTSIIEVTRTSVISQDATLTSTVTVTAGATATTTAVITSTVTTTVTATVPAVTATAVRRADVICADHNYDSNKDNGISYDSNLNPGPTPDPDDTRNAPRFYNLNPLIDCDKLLVGYYVCVGK